MGIALVRTGTLCFALGTDISNITKVGFTYYNITIGGFIILGLLAWLVTLSNKNVEIEQLTKQLNEIKRGN